MRAGLLRERCDLIEERTQQNPVTGSVRRERVVVKAGVPCFRQTKKEQAAMLGKEQGSRGTLILQMRRSPSTDRATHVNYEAQLYRIEPNPPRNIHDNTIILTCTLVNE